MNRDNLKTYLTFIHEASDAELACKREALDRFIERHPTEGNARYLLRLLLEEIDARDQLRAARIA